MDAFAWPLAALVFATIAVFVFRRNVAGLIDRIRKIERFGITATGGEQAQPVPETKPNSFQELMDSTSSPLLRERENGIREMLRTRGITNEQEVIKILTRALASSQLTLQWEQIEKTMFGSQLGILVEMNSKPGGLSLATLREIYEAVVKQYPDFYAGYSFEQYFAYLENVRLVAKGGEGYQITLEGKEFMVWLVQAGKTHQRPH